jgi:lipid II:glycine glycyltransferase (peptidoglycan interpeptide bridge formation enzyme)
MKNHGFQQNEWNTLEVGLLESTESLWASLSSKARNRIRKAEGFGLVVRSSPSPGFLERHFPLVQGVFRRHRRAPPLARADLQTICSLEPAGKVFLIEVLHPEKGEPVASGVFPHDSEVVYSLSTASSEQGRALCANDLLHWGLIRLAGAAGLTRYRMGDNYRVAQDSSRFKDKFGGSPVTVRRFVRHSSPLARYSSELFGAWKRLRQRFA